MQILLFSCDCAIRRTTLGLLLGQLRLQQMVVATDSLAFLTISVGVRHLKPNRTIAIYDRHSFPFVHRHDQESAPKNTGIICELLVSRVLATLQQPSKVMPGICAHEGDNSPQYARGVLLECALLQPILNEAQ